MYNKKIITFGFCDILNNQGLGKVYYPQPSASADNPANSTLFILDITKVSPIIVYYVTKKITSL